MVTFFNTIDDKLVEIDSPEKGCSISMVHPDEEEVQRIAQQTGADFDMLKAPLDPEERARIDAEDNTSLILVDIPTIEMEGKDFVYSNIPLGILTTENHLITVCLKDSHIMRDFAQNHVKGFFTYKKTRFILQILYRNASRYLQYLRQIDKKTNAIESELQRTLRNQELMQLMRLEKSLVFFATSLKSNEIVLEKLLRSDLIRRFPDDEDLLEDVIIENKQAIEMCAIYRDILSSTMDAFSSVISNNVNDIMKVLTSLTLVLSIPTLIASIWGMNVKVPFEGDSVGFWILLGASLLASIISIVILSKRRML